MELDAANRRIENLTGHIAALRVALFGAMSALPPAVVERSRLALDQAISIGLGTTMSEEWMRGFQDAAEKLFPR